MWPFKKKVADLKQLSKPEPLAPNGAFLLGHDMRGRAILAAQEDLAEGGLITGQAGSGKTTMNLLLAYQQIQRGGGLAYVQGRAEADIPQRLWEMACLCGREKDLVILDLGRGGHDVSYNPILRGAPLQIADRCLQLTSDTWTPQARQDARAHLVRVISCLQDVGLAFSLVDLAILTTYSRAMMELCERVEIAAPNSAAAAQLRGWLRGKSDAAIKCTLGGLAGRLFMAGLGKIGAAISSYAPGLDLRDAVLGNRIVYISMPTMGKDSHAVAAYQLVAADLQDAISEVRPDGSYLQLVEDCPSRPAIRGLVQSRQHIDLREQQQDSPWLRISFKAGAADQAVAAAYLLGIGNVGMDLVRALRAGDFVVQPGNHSEVRVGRVQRVEVNAALRSKFGAPAVKLQSRAEGNGADLHLEAERYLRMARPTTTFDATAVAVSNH